FVHHVLAMDTTFEGNRGQWRALTSPAIHHVAYGIIIAWEAAAGALCLLGAARLWNARHAPSSRFNHAKTTATIALTLGLLLWFVAFVTIGGEWFLMWQSRIWNGQEAAFRMFTVFALILIFLTLKDDELPA